MRKCCRYKAWTYEFPDEMPARVATQEQAGGPMRESASILEPLNASYCMSNPSTDDKEVISLAVACGHGGSHDNAVDDI